MDHAITIFAAIGVVVVMLLVFAGINILVQHIKDTIASWPRKDPMMKPHWRKNHNRKLVDKPYVYVVRDDGAYIRVDREFGFLHFKWGEQDIGAFVSHWSGRSNQTDLTMKGNWYEAMDLSDKWFPMGTIVTKEQMEKFWISHNKERRANEYA